MSDLRAAAQAVVDAFADPNAGANLRGHWLHLSDCITELRAALAQQEQEPVGRFTRFNGEWKESPTGIPLYEHPPRREWQGLSDDDIAALYVKWDDTPGVSMADFARAIEQALRSKNDVVR